MTVWRTFRNIAAPRQAGVQRSTAKPSKRARKEAQSSSMIDRAILDLARLREIYEDDRAGILDLLNLAVQTAHVQMETIDAAIGSHNAPDVRGAAHAIKGASLNVGAPETARVAAELEVAGAN